MLNLVEIETFITIVDSGSFRKAANRLFKTQPVLSYHIKQLEAYLGFELFDRTSYRATLTKQGRLFYPEAYSILQHSTRIDLLRKSHDQREESSLSLTISSLYPRQHLYSIIKEVNQIFPNTVLEVSIDTLAGHDKLQRKEVDIAITEIEINSSMYFQEHSQLVRMLPCISSSHQLAKKKEHSKVDLLTIPQIVLKSSGKQAAKDKGIFKFSKQWVVSEMALKKEFIKAGYGWGNLPLHLIQDESKSFTRIQFRPSKEIEVQLYKLRKKEDVGVVKNFIWDLL